MARSIQSPGVEIIEKDYSLSPVLPAGTNIFITGFAGKGPIDEILQITSTEELEQVYGVPTNSSERYFYYSARQILNSSSGNLYVSRLPYGEGTGDGYGSSYGALVYPTVAVYESETIVCRNTKFISGDYFALPEVVTQILSVSSLSANVNTLTSVGLNVYHKFNNLTESSAITAGLRDYYDLYYADPDPAIAAVALTALSLIQYFVNSPETVVTTDLTKDKCTYLLGAPKFFDLTKDQYEAVLDSSAFRNSNQTWAASSVSVSGINSPADFGKAGLIIVNKIQSTINNRYEGHYIGLADNTNLLPNTDHTAVRKIYTNGQSATGNGMDLTEYTEIPSSRYAFPLTATSDSGSNRNSSSISEALEKTAMPFADIATSRFDDSISFGLFKLRTSPYNPDATTLSFAFEEAKTGSLDYYRQLNSQLGGVPQSFYLGNVINNSNNVNVLVNTNINSKNNGSWLDNEGFPKRKVRVYSQVIEENMMANNEVTYKKYGFHLNDVTTINNYISEGDALFPLGSYSTYTTSGKTVGLLPLKIDRTLRKIENDELFDLDLVCEAGLGTIYATACANEVEYFEDTQGSSGMNAGLESIRKNDYIAPDNEKHNIRDNYSTIFQIFDNFCSKLRKDCMFIADPLRQIFVTGSNTLVMSDHNKSFSQYIYNPLRHLYETANSSYATTYGNWVKVNDMFTGINVWVPFSAFAAADMANVDRDFQPWYAPAGFTRGRITNVLSVAVAPKQKERDMLYKISINPVAFFPNDGINIFGQKTLLRQPSAFDRINVRRLFLYLEKATKKTVKYFVFEPNTIFTRNRVNSVLSPIFDRAKNTQGLYEYQLVCDERNNPPSVIDQNEMVIDIYIKPVRSAEFILVNFYATSTGTNFNELIGG